MAYQDQKSVYGTRLAKIVDIHLHKCKYTDEQWIVYGAGTLQTTLTDTTTGPIALSGTQALQFTESNVWLLIGTELIKCTVTTDTTLSIISRGEFGTTAAAHSIGATVSIKHSGEVDGTCYGLTDCSAKNNYVKGLDLILRFPSVNLEFGEKYFHGFSSEKSNTPTIKPSESIGSRGGTNITILDGLDPDSYVPYANHRTNQGTLFTKLLARNPYFEGRRVTVYDGFDIKPLNLANFEKREYIIDDLQINKGEVSIKGVDPLILTEDKKSKAPQVTPISLATAIDGASTFFDYRESLDFFFGPVGTQFYVRIDSEVILCEVLSEVRITIVTRGIKTDVKNHSIGATVQYVLYYEKQNVVEIIVDLLENFTTIDADFLDDYTDVISKTAGIQLTAYITKPESTVNLINELLRVGLLSMWFSPTESKIKIMLSNDPSIEPVTLTEEDNIGIDSFKDSRKSDQQITRSSIAYAPNDITKTSGDENFSVVYKSVNAIQELAQNKGEVNEQKTFYCRWLQDSNDIAEFDIAVSVVDNEVSRNELMPVEIEFELDMKDVGEVVDGNVDLASVVSVTTSRRVNPDGTPLSKNYQITNISNSGLSKRKVKALLYQQFITGDTVDFTISESKENYVLADDPAFTPVADTHYSILIANGVKIGATSVLNYAFDTGALPTGITLTIYVQGQILGAGGAGGNGGFAFAPNPSDSPSRDFSNGNPGFNGGNCFNITVPTLIYAGSGLIAAGGGGSSGKYSVADSRTPIYINAGNGGCGGQGYVESAGGFGGTAAIDSSPLEDYGLNGNNGSNAGPGILGSDSGGRYGENGDGDPYSLPPAFGGVTGIAIKKNGNTVTILSGAIGLFGNIRGRIED